jgi:hypothetical protein
MHRGRTHAFQGCNKIAIDLAQQLQRKSIILKAAISPFKYCLPSIQLPDSYKSSQPGHD